MASIKSHSKKSIHKNTQQNLPEKIIQDLEEIYQAAFEAGNFAAALKAKELQLKEYLKSADNISMAEQLIHLSEKDLATLLADLEKKIGIPPKEL